MIDFSTITAVALGADDVLQIQDSHGTVLWQKTVPLANYFYIEDISGSANTVTIKKTGGGAPTITPYYSTDQQTWTSMGSTSTYGITATVPANGKLYIKCTADRWSSGWGSENSIECSGNYRAGGNIMSILNGDNFENTNLNTTYNSQFFGLFKFSTKLIDISPLVLPNNTTTHCYSGFVWGCSNLTTLCALPATTMTNYCYSNMCYQCTSLTATPALPATTLDNWCYDGMFQGCTSLNKVYVYADTLGSSTTNNWLQNVAATGDFYALGSASWTIDSPSGVPVGWTLHHSLPVPCNVSISAGSNGTVSVNGVSGDYSDTVMSGTVLTIAATADSGYMFDSWSDGDTNASRTITVTGDLTLTASFAQAVNYNVSISAGNNGSVSVNGVSGDYSDSVPSGTVLTIEGTGTSGYDFDTWSDGNTDNPRTITVTGDLTLTASFAQVVYYNVSVSAGSNGTVSVNGVSGDYSDTVMSGTQLTLVATPDAGYQFDSWSDGDTNATRTVTITGNTTLTASFAVIAQPNDELWYRTSNNQPISLTNMSFGNVSVVSNTYTNGKGVVKFSGNLTSISNSAINNPNTNLTHIWFPDSLTTVNRHSFDNCPIENLDLNNITTVGEEAFDFHHTAHIHIPATCTSLTMNPFRSSYTTSITVDPNNPVFTDGSSHNGSNCVYSGTTLVVGCVNTVIPDNCTVIGEFGLCDIAPLTTVDFPSTIRQLKNFAVGIDSTVTFNPSLSVVYARSTPTFGNGVFIDQKTNGTLYYTNGVNYSTWLNKLPRGWTAVRLCDVTVSAGNNGSVSVNGTSGNYHQSELPSGTQLTLVATPAAGYQFDSWSDGNTNATRTVTITADTTLTASFVQQQPVGEPFYIEDASGNANTLSITTRDAYTPTFEVFSSTDGTNWTSMGTTAYGTPLTATVPANSKLYLKATTNRWGLWQMIDGAIYNSYNSIDCTGNYNIGGNVMSLLNGDNYSGATLDSNYDYQFYHLFHSSTHLVDASDLELPSNTAPECYRGMFISCSSLVTPPVLSATTLANSCYTEMFRGCTSLTQAPVLPATTLADGCYNEMFRGCTSLTQAPVLPATTLADGCYDGMFGGCTSLTQAPVLPATTLADHCYHWMFQYCTSLNTVTTYANDISASNCLNNWLNNVAQTGDFYNLGTATYTSGDSGIPQGWTEHHSLSEPFYVEDVSDSNNTLIIRKNNASAPTIEVFSSTDGTNWSSMGTTSTTAITATIPANGKLYLKATANQWSNNFYNNITVNRNHNIGGNIMSLLVGDNYTGATLDSNYTKQFFRLFNSNTHLVDASDLELPSNVTQYCYHYMFGGCTSLTTAPALPATTLAQSCYSGMFNGCTSLTTAPALPATTLAQSCYNQMFWGCTALTQAPTLPAITLATNCYQNMFYGCTALTTAPALPATTLAEYCYCGMFADCTSLTTAPALPATTLADYCYYWMFADCSLLNRVDIYADDISAVDCLYEWLNNVAATGDFYNLGSATYTASDPSGIPTDWTEHTSL